MKRKKIRDLLKNHMKYNELEDNLHNLEKKTIELKIKELLTNKLTDEKITLIPFSKLTESPYSQIPFTVLFLPITFFHQISPSNRSGIITRFKYTISAMVQQ